MNTTTVSPTICPGPRSDIPARSGADPRSRRLPITSALAASRRLVRNRQLRKLLSAWTAFYTGSNAHAVLVIVLAFSAGGAAAVGAATVIRVLPGGLIAPLAAGLATSPRPHLHLAIGIGARVVTMMSTIVAVASGAPLGVVLAIVAADSVVSAGVRPLHGALVVGLASTAAEAAAANAVTRSLVSASALAGPALAGVVLSTAGIRWAFILPAAAFALGTAAALMIRIPHPTAPHPARRVAGSGGFLQSQLHAIGAGFRPILQSRPATAASLLAVVNIMLLGVWYVASAAVARDVLGLGESGITTIATLNGAGGLVGALMTLSIVGRPRLARTLAGSMLALAASLGVIGLVGLPAVGLVLAAGAGAATAVGYVLAPALVQRSVTPEAMVPVAASQQSLSQVANAAGATIAPTLIAAVGVPAALAILGASAALIVAAVWPQLRRTDDLSPEDAAKLAVVSATPALSALPGPALEQLARASARCTVPAGTEVIRQGDRGDRFYMIAAGLADVTVDGRRVATLGPGGSFGEIALLHNTPRTATVTAREGLDLIVVDQAEFLGALAGAAGVAARLAMAARTRLTTTPLAERQIDLDDDHTPSTESLASLLAAHAALAGWEPAALVQLAQAARVIAVPDGSLITREGDHPCSYSVILTGGADLLADDHTVLRTLRPGDGVGEDEIRSAAPRRVSTRALGDTTVLTVAREAVLRRSTEAGRAFVPA